MDNLKKLQQLQNRQSAIFKKLQVANKALDNLLNPKVNGKQSDIEHFKSVAENLNRELENIQSEIDQLNAS